MNASIHSIDEQVLGPNQATTANNAITNLSSLNKTLDLFFVAGSSRNNPDLASMFSAALNENVEFTLRIMQWARDVRGGAGERDAFKVMLTELIDVHPLLADRIIAKIPELGRWDDMFVAFGTQCERTALRLISAALRDENGLCAKWMPRKGPVANTIRSYLKMTPKAYRKLIVGLSNTVEQKMCANQWDQIVYSSVPSVAAARYQHAFQTNDTVRYNEYVERLKDGTDTVNASAVYPYDVVRSLRNGNVDVANKQWDSLENYLTEANGNILPVVDVSGSMNMPVSGSVSAMDVSISLGLYISERNTGIFKDHYITFSKHPELQHANGSLFERYQMVRQSDWGYNTDIDAVFTLLLKNAKSMKASNEDMPSVIIILSDMEFDSAVSGGRNAKTYDNIKSRYFDAGYTMPRMVFWNLNGRKGNVPVTMLENGTALVSGFSPSIMKSLLGQVTSPGSITPISVMLDTVNIERYRY